MRRDARRRAGFTLIEALAALALLVAFAGAVGPHLFHARRILASGKGRVIASLLLRSLIEAPFDRSRPPERKEGETGGFRWRVEAEPIFLTPPIFAFPAAKAQKDEKDDKDDKDDKDEPRWTAYRVAARVAWSEGRSISAETIRLVEVK